MQHKTLNVVQNITLNHKVRLYPQISCQRSSDWSTNSILDRVMIYGHGEYYYNGILKFMVICHMEICRDR